MRKYRKLIITILVVLAFCISICFIPIDATRFVSVVEKQAEQELGVKVHIEKLIFRFGPNLKIKAPTMHVMYSDGQKFAQMDNVKFYVPWSTLYSDEVKVKRIYADKFILKIKSNDKYISQLIKKINDKEYKSYPNIRFNNYNMMYFSVDNNKMYQLKGAALDINKIDAYKNFKLFTEGQFFINDKLHISYNITLTPNIEYKDKSNGFNLLEFTEQVENLDFHSDIMADVKIYENKNGDVQMSGTVNIDNISVLDPNKKNPRSFIYLTFLGNKTGVLSNIYASADKKIYIEGVVNNSKKPDIDLKVKTDNIRIADIYNKVKLFADLSRFKGINKIDGNLLADFNIKGDLNKLKSAGYLKITDGILNANGINVRDINSDIDLSNNSITISKAVGYVNQAPITLKGVINKELNIQLLMDKVELKHLLPAKYGISEGKISLNAAFGGTLDKLTHKENINIERFKAQNNDVNYSFDKLNINTNTDNTTYISNIIIKPKMTEVIKLPLLKLIIDDNKIKIPDTNIFMPNSKLRAKAELTDINTNNCSINMALNGNINSKDLSGLTNVSAVYPVKAVITGNKNTQNIETQVQLIKATLLDEPALINFSAVHDNGNLKIDDLSLLSFNANFSDNFKSNLKNPKKIIINGNVENIKEPVFKNLRVFIPQQLNLNIQNTIAQAKGDIFINGSYKKPEIVGQISASNIINQFLQLVMNNVTVDFNKNTIVLNAPVIKFADSNLGINSVILTDFTKGINIKNITVKSKYLNLDTILMYKDASLSNCPLKIQDGKFYAERASASLYGGNIYLSGVNADLKLENNILYINNIMSDMYNGKFAGNIDFDLKNDSYNSKLQARNVSASPIFDIVMLKKDSLSGSMDFDANISGSLLSKQSLNGNIKFIVHNGHMGMLGKLEHLLYAQNVIADNMLRTSLSAVTRAITLRDTGLFKYLRGNIDLKDGIAQIHYLQSQGPLMSLFIKGQYNPMIDYAKLTVLGRLSDELVESLGAFGDFSFNKLMIMLTGDENNKLNIPAEDIEKLPQLPAKNTKEFRTVINGILEKPSSVIQFNWISYTKKSLKQKEVPMTNEKVPDFIEALPY